MLNSFEDLKSPLQCIFNVEDAGDTLTIWDRYFIGGKGSLNVCSIANIIASVRQIKHVVVYIDNFKLNYDTRTGDGLVALRNLGVELGNHNISFAVFDYASGRDHSNRIHGRYWLSGASGFLMDGSLSGIGTDLCIAVTMDQAIFSKISNVLESKKRSYCRLIDLVVFRSRFSSRIVSRREETGRE
jgi:hypothetical protein